MEVQKIPLSSVYPSPMNPRKTFDEEDLRELADNIEKQGLLQPITVRPVRHPNNEFNDRPDKYEVVCGERRYRACKMLQEKWSVIDLVAPENRFGTILAIVREMDDDEAFDAMITENLQRKDVDPMEEAFAFGKLMDKGQTAEEIAARFGKSVRFVQDRCKLNELIPECIVAVKDGKMPIVAAQIISKLEPKEQKEYYKRFDDHWEGFSKKTAQNFVDNLFMRIERSVWNDNNKPDFNGGCGKKCSECEFNTANHGCLFYEMKTEDAGKCTDRARFNKKSLDFILFVLERNLDKFVKNGEPLERGKKVIAIKREMRYDSKEIGEMKDRLIDWLSERDIQIVDPDEVFSYRCYYDLNDERSIQLLEEGKVYPVVSLMTYDCASIGEKYWYVKNSNEVTVEGTMKPIEVQRKVSELKNLKNGLESSLHCECAKTMSAKSVPTSEPLTEVEKKAFCLLVMDSSFRLQKAVGVFEHANREELYNAYSPDMFEQAVRAFLQDRISVGNTQALHAAAPMLDEIGAIWCKKQYEDTKEKVVAKHDKKVAKLVKELAALGYDENGDKIEEKKEDATRIKLSQSSNLLEQYDAMKEKHPEYILLFRVGDFYEAFKKDAEDIAEILGITLTHKGDNALSGFPHHALDTYLPKIVRAGRRVAICEELENQKNR